MQPQTLLDNFFEAAVRTVCHKFGLEDCEIIFHHPTHRVAINKDMSDQKQAELAMALEDVAGQCTH